MESNISIIIPTYNSWDTLRVTLRSLQAQSLKPREIIVVDNASTDSTANNIQKYFSKIKLIKNKKNLGVSGGRNSGIKNTSKNTEFVLFFDHDMVADKNMLKELKKTMLKDSRIGIATPKIFYKSNKKRIWSAGTDINLWTGQVVFRGGEDRGQYETEEQVSVAPAALLVKMSLLDKLKGFDLDYFATFEDTDFCFRAKRSGFLTYYCPQALAFHDLSTSKDDEADRLLSRAYWVARNRIIFMKKFGRSFLVFLFMQPIFIFYYMILAVKYRRFVDGISFFKGLIAGILYE